jgi:hypothetical protein
MPKQMIDATELLAKLQAERAELDAAIKALTKYAYQNITSSDPTRVKPKSHHKQPSTAPASKPQGRHVFTQAEREHLRRKLRAYWAKRKAAAK